MVASWFKKVRNWFRPRQPLRQCLQCGLFPGREYMVHTDEPILHPHECSWCKSVVYVPGPMFECKICSENVREHVA